MERPKTTSLQIALICSLCKKNQLPRPKSFPEYYEQAERLIKSLTPTSQSDGKNTNL